MKLIVFSATAPVKDEAEVITALFEAGLKSFHLRKGKFSLRQMINLIKSLPEQYHNRIVIHSHHYLALGYNLKGIHLTRKHLMHPFLARLKVFLFRIKKPGLIATASLHSTAAFSGRRFFSYIFLSPVYDSISKKNYYGAFNLEKLGEEVAKSRVPVIALGGITPGKLPEVKQMNFAGAALSGAVWTSGNPVEVFKQALREAETL